MPSARTSLTLAILLVVVVAFLPRPLISWLTHLHGPATVLLAPLQQPARSLVVWFRGPGGAGGPGVRLDESPEEKVLREQRDQYALEVKQLRQQVEEFRVLIKDLSRGFDLNPSLAVKQMTVPVIGFGADTSGGLLAVRAGRRDGVSVSNVVAIRGVHLLGRVVRVDERTCAVLPITRMSRGDAIGGVVMLSDETLGPTVVLKTVDGMGGVLRGLVEYLADPSGVAPPVAITPDMIVRLRDSDGRWPQSSQMLIIGKIEKAEPSPEIPTRTVITVRPLHDIERASEVMIRVPDAEESTRGADSPTGGKP